MRNMVILALFLSFVNLCSAAQKSKPITKPHGLSIEQAVAIGWYNRPQLKAFAYSIQAFRSIQHEELAGYLPQLRGVAFAGKPILGEPGKCRDLFFEASQLLFSFAGPIERQNIARQDTRAEEERNKQRAKEIRFEVESNFLQSWLIQKKWRLIEQLDKTSRLVYERNRHRWRLGLISLNEWLQAIADYKNSQAAVANFQNDLYHTFNDFKTALGCIKVNNNDIIPRLDWTVPTQPPTALKALERYYHDALVNRDELNVDDELIERERLQSLYHKKEYLPTISLLTVMEKSHFSFGPYREFEAGFLFDWKMFDGFAKLHKATAASNRRLQLVMTKASQTQEILLEVQHTYYTLLNSHELYKYQLAQYREARNDLLLNEERCAVGLISPVDLEIAKLNWQNMRYAWINFLTQMAITHCQLNFTAGYPPDTALSRATLSEYCTSCDKVNL